MYFMSNYGKGQLIGNAQERYRLSIKLCLPLLANFVFYVIRHA